MYSYTYDETTGGLLLNLTPTGFSKEPRPVYAPELDILGFSRYWKYDKQTDFPYMWAEANNYYYRGKLVAKLKGGNVYTAPEIQVPALACDTTFEKQEWKQVWIPPQSRELHNADLDQNGIIYTYMLPEPEGLPLRPVNIEAMVEANQDILEIIEYTTVKKIIAVYSKYRDQLDLFHVAFSGGKDSCVLLDLVRKALPRGSYVVVFGDTGMEFPDTYEVVEKTRRQCVEEGIPFYIAKSHMTPKESWEMFGPPSRTLRWCCSVHKSAPQTLKLREITGKDNYTGLAFVGVRAQESATRAEYDYLNEGKKVRGQFSHNPILEWTSAEVWLYIYANDVPLNEAYKKGSSRVGCICCPMGGGKSGFIEYTNYRQIVDGYFEAIRRSNGRKGIDVDEYIQNGGWSARKNGRDLFNNTEHCLEKIEDEYLTVTVENPSSDWREWIKTIVIPEESYSVVETKTGYIAKIKEEAIRQRPILGRLFRQVFHKAACCKGCKVCEANCVNSAIEFTGNRVHINNCIHCGKCHAIDSGCLLYHSLRQPQGGGKARVRTLNTMSNHAPKTEWLADFFERGNSFFTENSLNRKNQLGPFSRFLRDAQLIDKDNKITPFAEIITAIGWGNNFSQGLMLINLVAENPQIKWYVTNFEIGNLYPKKNVIEMLLASGVEPSKSGKYDAHESICYAYKRLSETPLGTSLHWGFVTKEGELVRTKCTISDPRVILYGLFVFAEKCNDYKEFTLATLLNDSIDRDGISPTRIFGLDRDDMVPMLLGLSARYPEFISASFTHDLEKISLAEDKTSADVLDLFKGENGNAE